MGDAIFTRVSIREFTDEPVSDEQVERLMEAAMAAPSAGATSSHGSSFSRVIRRLRNSSPRAVRTRIPRASATSSSCRASRAARSVSRAVFPWTCRLARRTFCSRHRRWVLAPYGWASIPSKTASRPSPRSSEQKTAAFPSRSSPLDTPRRCSIRAVPSVSTCHVFAGYSETYGMTT